VLCVFMFLCSVYVISYVDFSYRSSLYGLCFMLLLCFMWLPYIV